MSRGRLLGALLWLLALPALALDEAVIGVADTDVEHYEALAQYLNTRSGLPVRFAGYNSYAELRQRLADGELQGAILSPYHYVMLSAHEPDLTVIGRLNRGGSKVLQQADIPGQAMPELPTTAFGACHSGQLTPQAHYRPVLITRQLSPQQPQVWPPRENRPNRLRLGVRSEQSTSSFLFPTHHVQDQLDLAGEDSLEVLRVRDWTSVDPSRALDESYWRDPSSPVVPELQADDLRVAISEMHPFTWRALRVAVSDYLLVHELGQPQSRIDLAGISSHWLDAYTGDRSFFRVVATLDPIPYDPVVLSGEVSDAQAKELADAFVSTDTLPAAERDALFPVWTLPITQPRSGERQLICRRVPDIHSVIKARDPDYDAVRRTAVLLAGGSVVRLGLSEAAHWKWGEDRSYFEALKLKLASPGDGSQAAGERPIFLEYTLDTGADFYQLAQGLEEGRYDIAELNAWEAGRLVSKESATLLGQALYRDRHVENNGATTLVDTDNYVPVVVYAGDEELSKAQFFQQMQDECLAVARGDASSVNRYALHKAAYRGTPIATEQLTNVSVESEIFRVLMAHASGEGGGEREGPCAGRSAARFGLMPEFHYVYNRDSEWNHPSPLRAIRLGLVSIPNAMLLFSRDYATLDEDLQVEGAGWQRALRGLLQPDVVELTPELLAQRGADLRRLRRTLGHADVTLPRSGQDTGFIGYTGAGRLRATELKDVHQPYTRNWTWVILTAIALIVVATALLVFRGRGGRPLPWAGERRAARERRASRDAGGPESPPLEAPPPGFNVFISYRRHDSADITGRIYDRLVERYSEEQVFKDVDDIKPGQNFLDVIHETIEKSHVILVVIGRQWRGEAGREDRIMEPEDVVRLEVGSALEHGIHVIPLYVNGVQPPGKDDLPENLQRIRSISGINVRPDPDFRIDMHRLMERLRELEREAG